MANFVYTNQCQATPEEFLNLVDNWRVLSPEEEISPDEAFLNIYLSVSNEFSMFIEF